jgi:flavorubredoxin
MTTIHEVAPDVFRISTWVEPAGIQFAQFLVRDDEPLLFHTGMRGLFAGVRDAVAKLIDPARLRWISFSHFEADECGALNDWLSIAPNATAAWGMVGVIVSLNDFAARPPRPLQHNEILTTGRYRFRYLQTPHVPHCWEAGLMFEETTRTLFCSDLFQQGGDVEAVTESDVVGRHRESLLEYQKSPFLNAIPYTPSTEPMLMRLAALKPTTLATMHGSVFAGDGAQALRDLAAAWKEVLSKVALPPE